MGNSQSSRVGGGSGMAGPGNSLAFSTQLSKECLKQYLKKFDSDEVEVLKKVYKALSARSPGPGIDKETFLQYFPLPGLWGERLFQKFDYKGAGSVDYEEFLIGIAVCCRGTKSDRMYVLFQVFDLNSDGYIQKSELVAMLSNLPNLDKYMSIRSGKNRESEGPEGAGCVGDKDGTEDELRDAQEIDRNAGLSGPLSSRFQFQAVSSEEIACDSHLPSSLPEEDEDGEDEYDAPASPPGTPLHNSVWEATLVGASDFFPTGQSRGSVADMAEHPAILNKTGAGDDSSLVEYGRSSGGSRRHVALKPYEPHPLLARLEQGASSSEDDVLAPSYDEDSSGASSYSSLSDVFGCFSPLDHPSRDPSPHRRVHGPAVPRSTAVQNSVVPVDGMSVNSSSSPAPAPISHGNVAARTEGLSIGAKSVAQSTAYRTPSATDGCTVIPKQAPRPADPTTGTCAPPLETNEGQRPLNCALASQPHPAAGASVLSPASTQVVSISSLSPEEEAVVVPPPADRPAGAGPGSAAFPLLQPASPHASPVGKDGDSSRVSGSCAAALATGAVDMAVKSTLGPPGAGGGGDASCKSSATACRTPGGGQTTPMSASLSQQAKGLSRTASRLTSALKRTFSGTRSASPAAVVGQEQAGFADAGRGKSGGFSVTSAAAAVESSSKAISVVPSRQPSEVSVSQVRAPSPGSSAESRLGGAMAAAPDSVGLPVAPPEARDQGANLGGHLPPPVVVVLASSPRSGEAGTGSGDEVGTTGNEERGVQQPHQSLLQQHPGATNTRHGSGENQLSSEAGGGLPKPPTKSAMLLQAEKDKTRQEQAKKNPSPVAQSLINEEKVEESGQKDVLDVEGIVDKIIEECEFFEHGKLSFPEFKTWLERNDGILSMFTECLHEEVWGLQGNALYRSTGVQNRPSRLGGGALQGIFKDSMGSRSSGPQSSRDCVSGGVRGSTLMSSRTSSLSSRGGGLARGSSPFSGGFGVGSSSSLNGDIIIRMEQFHKVKRLFTNQAHPSPRRPLAGVESGCSSCYQAAARSSTPHSTTVPASLPHRGSAAPVHQTTAAVSVPGSPAASLVSEASPAHFHACTGPGAVEAHKPRKVETEALPVSSSSAPPTGSSAFEGGSMSGVRGSSAVDAAPAETPARTVASSTPSETSARMLATTGLEDTAGTGMRSSPTPAAAVVTAESSRVYVAPASGGGVGVQEMPRQLRVSVSVKSLSGVGKAPEQERQSGGAGSIVQDTPSFAGSGEPTLGEAAPLRAVAASREGTVTVAEASVSVEPMAEKISAAPVTPRLTTEPASQIASHEMSINTCSVASVASGGGRSCLPVALATPLQLTTTTDPLSAGAAAGAATGGAVRAAVGAVAGAAAAAAVGAAAASAAKAAVEDCRAGFEGAVATRTATATAVPKVAADAAEQNAKSHEEEVDQRRQAEQRDAQAGGAYQRFAGYSDWGESRMSPQLAVDIVSKELVEFIRCSHQSLHAAQAASQQPQTRASPSATAGAPVSPGQPTAVVPSGTAGGLAVGSSSAASFLRSKVLPVASPSPKTEPPANSTQSPRDLYSCPNCSNPLLLCPYCHSRYPQLTLYEGRVVMECVHCGEDRFPSTPTDSSLPGGSSGGFPRSATGGGVQQHTTDDVTGGIPVGNSRRIFTHCWHCHWELSKCAEMLKGSEAAIDGVLYKKGKHLHQWQARYYVLVDNMLYYYRRKGDAKPRGFMFLEGCYVELLSEQLGGRQHGFAIVHPKGETISKRLLFASSSKEQQEWVDALRVATKQQSLEQLYQVGEQLGHGKFSVVYKGIHRQTNEAFAIKVIDKGKISGHERELLRSEMAILRLLNHPNVIYMKELLDTKETLYIVMELVRGGELFDLIQQNHRLSELHVNRIISQLLSTVYYLHKCGIVHRDLKPENILLTDRTPNATIKLTDFGLSTLCAPNEVLYQPCGTLAYVAPEVLTMEGYNHQVDVWSVGVIMYLLLRGRLPFPMNKALGHPNFHQNHPVSFEGPVWREISSSAKDLIQRMLQPDPRQRVTVAEALQHIWIKNPTAVVNDGSKSIEVYINQLDEVRPPGRYADEGSVFQAPTFAIGKHPPKTIQQATPLSPASGRATNQQAVISPVPQQASHHGVHPLTVSSIGAPAPIPAAASGYPGGPGVLTYEAAGALRATSGAGEHSPGQVTSGLCAPGPPGLGRADAADTAVAINAAIAAAAATVSPAPQSLHSGAAGAQQNQAQSDNSFSTGGKEQQHTDSTPTSSAEPDTPVGSNEAPRCSGFPGEQVFLPRTTGMPTSMVTQSVSGAPVAEVFTTAAAGGGITSTSDTMSKSVVDEKTPTTPGAVPASAGETQNNQESR
ncbi:camk protein kinase [Cystoisospora suis]|uniref:non-specific serine/threonine protein kinase n=1 Tax=Cystoisospora suis TaxID=483139 RepID=A0A2C6KBD8_9APIC|nr:camk protein kinase [Cystoisospora suis]